MYTHTLNLAHGGQGRFCHAIFLLFNIVPVFSRWFYKELVKRSYLNPYPSSRPNFLFILSSFSILFLAVTTQAATPSLVRGIHNHNWELFIPADNMGTYWACYKFGPPNPNAATVEHFVLQQILYGKVFTGSYFAYGISGYTDSGTWGSQGIVNGWTYRQSYAKDSYAQAVVPSGYNVLQVITYNVNGSGGTLNVAWSDGNTSDLDVTSIVTNIGYYANITTVAKNATRANGTLALRVTAASSTSTRVIGFRFFNTSVLGDPNTASSGLSVGHTMITEANGTNGTTGGIYSRPTWTTGDTTRVLTSINSAMEFAIKTSIDGGTQKYTGGLAHFVSGGGDANYTHHSGEYGNGPVVFVNNVNKGFAYDNNTSPVRTVYNGNTIWIHSTGFGDYDSDGTEDANEPNFTWDYYATNSGLSIIVTCQFKVDSDVNLASYGLMLPILNTYSPTMQILPQSTVYDLNTLTIVPGGSSELIRLAGVGANIYVDSIGDVNSILWQQENTKLYNVLSVPNLLGGANPPANTIWVFGGKYQITTGVIDLAGDLNNDCRVDLADFAIFADNWLVDCEAEPNNPSCVPK